MARTTSGALSPDASAPPIAATNIATSATTAASSPSKVTKTRSERSSSNSRTTRQRARMISSASSYGAIQDMVSESGNGTFMTGGGSYSEGKGKGKAKAVQHLDTDMSTAHDFFDMHEEVCPITDKDEKPFPIMDLPTEIRLEVYRACLTRPYNILLSRREQSQQPWEQYRSEQANKDLLYDSDDTDEDYAPARARSHRVQRSARVGTTTVRRSNLQSSLRGFAPLSAHGVGLPSSGSGDHANADGTNMISTCMPVMNTNNTGTNDASTNAQPSSASSTSVLATTNPVTLLGSRPRRGINSRTTTTIFPVSNEPPRNQSEDPLLVNILRASKEIYKEARSVLYSENMFTLDLNTAMSTLACLHQRSRRHIKHIELEIPSYNEILERFQETVRLSLRYCSGLKKLAIHMPFTLPGADGSGTTGNTTVYANGFDILRWLPQECDVLLKGNVCVEIETVVNRHLQLAKKLDKLAYARRQLISSDTGPAIPAAA